MNTTQPDKPRVLVVDDDREIRDIIATMLTTAGYDVVDPDSGKSALASLARERFDVVVTDVVMPEVDGIAIVQAVRNSAPDCRVVAISGGSRRMPAAVGLRLTEAFGADAVLYKPFARAELLAAVSGRAPAP